MSRTYHHSRNWNRANPLHRDPLPGRYWARTTPSWYTRLFMNRPARAKDRLLTHKMTIGWADPEEVAFVRTGKKPHHYYW